MSDSPTPNARAAERSRVVHVAGSFQEADAWDLEQILAMSPDERRAAARVLKMRAFPDGSPDVRACREPR